MILIFLVLLSLTLRQLGKYAGRNIFGRQRASLFQAAFPDFHYHPFAASKDLTGLDNFSEFADTLSPTIYQLIFGAQPEIYNLIDDHHGNLQRSIFDLRTVSRGLGSGGSSAYISSVFLLSLPDHALTAFCLGRESFGHINLWGQDPDIDIDDEFIFFQKFHLIGPDRDAVIRLFDKPLVRFFRTNSELFTAGTLDVKQKIYHLPPCARAFA
jgi:hypothetical protein